ncbi:hypothetical protein SK3146_05083 [Paenibacillus konkukensis]|uniref:DUF6199 domain-containing protein n=1 Tax=Paenibacillus konkukensis TaxID=2020716 RepID=A0ABY4RTA4_9BACL|nr:DUF6199 family natural product biosynthesis protein [Paenibacillus konkukensis]UQZ85794.1 hypothetical protein SK3146_05083 [Paenibacillus konkukensis]
MAVLSILLMLCSLVMLWKPVWVWNAVESWKSEDGAEPSDLYIWSVRFGGVMCFLAGCGGIAAGML